jgi:hypothetical protein
LAFEILIFSYNCLLHLFWYCFVRFSPKGCTNVYCNYTHWFACIVAALQQLYAEWNETYDLQTTLRGWHAVTVQNDVDPCYEGAWFGVLCDFSTCPTYKVIGLWVSISLSLLTSFQSFHSSLLYTQLEFSSYKPWCSYKKSSNNSNWNYVAEFICLIHLL